MGDEVIRPQGPLFTARTDEPSGVVHARGHLDRVGAELLCGIVTALGRRGHRQIVVRLGPGTVVDDDAHLLLDDHARRLCADDGVRLQLR